VTSPTYNGVTTQLKKIGRIMLCDVAPMGIGKYRINEEAFLFGSRGGGGDLVAIRHQKCSATYGFFQLGGDAL